MKGYKFDAHGDIIPIDVYIIWGSPASGKSTYVKKHMEDGDLVVDLDLIKQSLSMKEKTATGENLLSIALMIRELLYNIIENREIECRNIWIVAGLPTKEEREKLKARLKPTKTIHIEATRKQCIDRALKDNERTDKELQFKVIDKWFKQYYYE